MRPAVAPAGGWSDWSALPLGASLAPEVLAEILDGGQSFRWDRGEDGAWTGRWGPHTARLRPAPGSAVEWCAPVPSRDAVARALPGLLAAGTDFGAVADRLPWRSDPHLARCMEAFPGLRLLRQPLGETLLCFLCSAAKRILQIKAMAADLAGRLGEDGALPTWEQLARCTEAELRACRLGFRARHVHAVARVLASSPGWLAATEAAPYPEAHARLTGLPGVGAKVADCVLLFGAGRLEAFPVDVWILRAMARRYGLEGWRPEQVSLFGRAHFGPAAGLAQQYLFAWERRHGQAAP